MRFRGYFRGFRYGVRRREGVGGVVGWDGVFSVVIFGYSLVDFASFFLC